MPNWRSRTYTYSEPDDDASDSRGEPTNPFVRGAGSRPDFDAGFDSGYRSGWIAGYGFAKGLTEHDLAVEGAGESPSLLL